MCDQISEIPTATIRSFPGRTVPAPLNPARQRYRIDSVPQVKCVRTCNRSLVNQCAVDRLVAADANDAAVVALVGILPI